MKIGIIGAGYVGRAIAAAGVRTGHDVMISNSRGPRTLTSDAVVLSCKVGTTEEAAAFGEVVVVAIPLKHFKKLPASLLGGKLVIDSNNYYPDRDEAIPELDSNQSTSSELLAKHLSGSKVVKAFNAIFMPHFERDGQPRNSIDRRALPLAGDDTAAKSIVADLYDQFGYDPIDVGPLAEGWRFQPGTPVYCIGLNKEWIQKALSAAVKA